MTALSSSTIHAPQRGHESSGGPRGGSRAVVIATIAPATGDTGVQTHSRTLLESLMAAGFDARLQTPFDGSPAWLPVFAVRPLLLSRLNKTWSTRWLRRWHETALRSNLLRVLRRQPVAALLAQCPLSARAGLDARDLLGASFPISMVCHFNYSEATEYRDRGELNDPAFYDQVLATERQVLERVDRVIYVSKWARRVVERERGIRPRNSSVIWNGITAEPPSSTLSRSDVGLTAHDLVMMNVGTLEPRKNQLALVEAFEKITGEFPAAKLVLIGEGPARPAIEERVGVMHLESKVRLLGRRRDVPALLALADMYVHASTLENCPVALLEAARARLPIVAAPAGGVPELLEALGGSPLDLASPMAALRPLLMDREARTRAGCRARAAFEQTFTRDSMVHQYMDALALPAATQTVAVSS